MSTFIGAMISDITQVSSTPIWGDAIGITIGCLLGIVVPKMILGSSSETKGLNRISARVAFLGELNQ